MSCACGFGPKWCDFALLRGGRKQAGAFPSYYSSAIPRPIDGRVWPVFKGLGPRASIGKKSVTPVENLSHSRAVAYAGPPMLVDYSMTKGAQVAMVRCLSNQLLSKGIRVNAGELRFDLLRRGIRSPQSALDRSGLHSNPPR